MRAIDRERPRGMTMIEVLLALFVLVVALAGIGALTTMGRQSGADARDLTMGQLLCEGKIAEVTAGILPASNAQGTFPEDPDWIYAIEATPAGTPGLLTVRVTVTQNPATYMEPMEFALVRWIPDPNYAAELAQ